MPFRLPHGDGLAFHPRGKAFVQPNIVPPLHSDQVAEPLVRDFMRDDRGHRLVQTHRGLLVIDQEYDFPIRNESCVLIAPAEKSGRPIMSSFSNGYLMPK